jgi:hypothetical protein
MLKIIRKKTSQTVVAQIPGEISGDNLNNTCDAIRHFRNKKKEYLKRKINGLARTVSTISLETCIEK